MKTKSAVIALTKVKEEKVTNIICVPSSWTKPQTYHILMEDTSEDTTRYEGEFTAEQVYERFDIDVIPGLSIGEVIRATPNDGDLGKKIRNLYNEIKGI